MDCVPRSPESLVAGDRRYETGDQRVDLMPPFRRVKRRNPIPVSTLLMAVSDLLQVLHQGIGVIYRFGHQGFDLRQFLGCHGTLSILASLRYLLSAYRRKGAFRCAFDQPSQTAEGRRTDGVVSHDARPFVDDLLGKP